MADSLPGIFAGATHLTFEQIAGYVDQTLDRTESPFVTDHLASCIQCERAVDDLRAFTAEDTAPNPTPATATAKQSIWERARGLFWPSSPAPAFGWALAALLFLVLAGWWLRSVFTPKTPAPELARQETPPPSPVPPSITPSPETVPLLAQLTDGTGRVTLDQRGNLSGLEALSPAYQRLVKEALTTQRLPASGALQGLNRRGSSLMGGDEQGNKFSLITPAGKVVFSDRPIFRWTRLGGATAYVVEIYDAQFTLVMTSEPLQRTEWTPQQPLARGGVYVWQVKATKDGQEVLAPKPPAAQARFRVLAQTTADEIAQARRAYASSHLTLGLLYAQAGLLDEADQELRALLKANPNSTIVRRYLAQVQALRR